MIETGERFRPFIESRLGELPADAHFLAQTVGGEPRFVVAFHDATDSDIWLSMAGERASPLFVRCVFGYVFQQLGLPRCSAWVRADRTRALDIDLRLGFKVEGIRRKAEAGHDLYLLGMMKEECRWVRDVRRKSKPLIRSA